MSLRLRCLCFTGLALLSNCSDPVDNPRQPRGNDGSDTAGRTTPEDSTRANELPCPQCEAEQQGGETSEFGGAIIGSCPEIAQATELPLEQELVAAWKSSLDGHYEIPLRWQPSFLGNSVTGYEPDTSITMDIAITAARRVQYGSGGATDYEGSACDNIRETHVQAEVQMSVADGSLTGRFRQWLTPVRAAGDIFTTVSLLEGNQLSDLSNFDSQLEFSENFSVDADVRSSLHVSLRFEAGELSGVLGPRLELTKPEAAPNARHWFPLSGQFPPLPVPCGSESTLTATSVVELPGGSGGAALALLRESFERIGPVQAVWQDGRSTSGSESSASNGRTQTLSITVGEPTAICEFNLNVHAPLQLTSEDGSIQYEESLVWLLSANSGEANPVQGITTESPWIPVEQFEDFTGVRNLDLGQSEFARTSLYMTVDRINDTTQGTLEIPEWQNYSMSLSPGQQLRLCWGPQCEETLCVQQAKTSLEHAACFCPEDPSSCEGDFIFPGN